MENATLHLASGEPTGLSVRHFRVEEALSSLFSIRVRAVSPDTSLDLGRLVGHDVTFGIVGRTTRIFKGIVASAGLAKVAEHGESLGTYEIEIVPSAWRLTQRRSSRLFQHMTLRQMVSLLLEEWQIPHRWEIADDVYPRLELRTQYDETDFAFVSRLLQEGGISFWFDLQPDAATLVLGDKPHAAEARAVPIPFVDDTSTLKPGFSEYVTDVRLREQSRPGRVTLRDHDVRQPRYPAYARAESARAEDVAHEQFVYAHGAFRAEGAPQGSLPTPTADDRGVSRTRETRGNCSAGSRTGARASSPRETARRRSGSSTPRQSRRRGPIGRRSSRPSRGSTPCSRPSSWGRATGARLAVCSGRQPRSSPARSDR